MIFGQIAICDGLFIMGLGDRLCAAAAQVCMVVTEHIFSEVCL